MRSLVCRSLFATSLLALAGSAVSAPRWTDRSTGTRSSTTPGVVTIHWIDAADARHLTVREADGSLSHLHVLEPAALPGDPGVGSQVTLVDPLPTPVRAATRIARGEHPEGAGHAGDARYADYSNRRYDPDRAPGITTIGELSWMSDDGRVIVLDTPYGTKTFLVDAGTELDVPTEELHVGRLLRVSSLPTDETTLVARGYAWVSEPRAALIVPEPTAPVFVREPMQGDRDRLNRRVVTPTRLPDTATPLPLIALMGLVALGVHGALLLARRV